MSSYSIYNYATLRCNHCFRSHTSIITVKYKNASEPIIFSTYQWTCQVIDCYWVIYHLSFDYNPFASVRCRPVIPHWLSQSNPWVPMPGNSDWYRGHRDRNRCVCERERSVEIEASLLYTSQYTDNHYTCYLWNIILIRTYILDTQSSAQFDNTKRILANSNNYKLITILRYRLLSKLWRIDYIVMHNNWLHYVHCHQSSLQNSVYCNIRIHMHWAFIIIGMIIYMYVTLNCI